VEYSISYEAFAELLADGIEESLRRREQEEQQKEEEEQ